MQADVVVRKPGERAMRDFRCPRAEHLRAAHAVSWGTSIPGIAPQWNLADNHVAKRAGTPKR